MKTQIRLTIILSGILIFLFNGVAVAGVPQHNATEHDSLHTIVQQTDSSLSQKVLPESQIQGQSAVFLGMAQPDKHELYQNFPNPFNPSTEISFSIAEPTMVQLGIYNLLGQRVRSLLQSTFSVGTHTVRWDGTDDWGRRVPGGIYFYRMEANGWSATRKMMALE